MDIPPEYVSLNKYTASLGHKINHSFDPNCRLVCKVYHAVLPTLTIAMEYVKLATLIRASVDTLCHLGLVYT